jgi:hypothetical protein
MPWQDANIAVSPPIAVSAEIVQEMIDLVEELQA